MHINDLNEKTTENRTWDKDLWGTPIDLFNEACKKFNFEPTLDVCATAFNSKCRKCYTADIDAFTQDWDEPFFVNPPYSLNRDGRWIYRAVEQSKLHKVGFLVLVFAKTDTVWWHDCVGSSPVEMKKNKVEPWFIRGRVSFLKPDGTVSENSAPYASVFLYFKA